MEGALNNLSKLNLNKDVFKQKGGTLGLILLAIAAIALIFHLPEILAWVNNLFKLAVVGTGLAAFLYVLFDKKARMLISTLYMMGIKKAMGMVIKMDPISILQDAILKMKRSIAKMEDNMGKLNGVRISLKEKIASKKEELRECLERKKIAERKQNKDLATIEDRQSVRLHEMCQMYIDLSESSEKWYKIMSKIADMANLTVLDAENEVEIQKEKYEAVKLSHSAFKSAMSVIKGDPDELAMYNQAFQYVHDDIMGKLGEMDRVINTAGGLIDKIDVEKEVYAIKGNDLMKKYDEMGLDALFTKFEEKPKIQEIVTNGTTSTSATVNYGGQQAMTKPDGKKYF